MPTRDLRPSSASNSIPPAPPAQIRRERGNGLDLIAVETPAMAEFHLTAVPGRIEPFSGMVNRVAELLQLWDAVAVRVIAFGALGEEAAGVAALRRALNDPTLPVTWVEGAAGDGRPVAGMQVHAIAGTPVQTVSLGDRIVGRFWSDNLANHCVLGGLGPGGAEGSRSEQVRKTFVHLQAALAVIRMGMKDVARTWLFLDDILSWYEDFNKVRTDFFSQAELRPGAFPASTGVAGRNASGAAVTAAAWAVQPLDPAFKAVSVLPSPQQCPAPAYGSSFSRAVEIRSAGFRQLLISGTASLAPDGSTTHAGDARAQIDLTMQVIRSILESRRMSMSEVTRATAYFKRAADVPVFADWLAGRGLQALPVVNACCDICRDDLLFEIEVDAIQAGS